MSNRFWQILLIFSTCALSWLGIMAVHELGHCLFTWAGGGRVAHVALHPFVISRTDIAPNPHPLLAAWGGALSGVAIPAAVFWIAQRAKPSIAYLFRFFAGFCLVFNGFYIAEDSFIMAADGGDLIRYGSPRWSLVAFGVLAVSSGMWLWNGLGRHFGLSGRRGMVDRAHAIGVTIILVAVAAVEFLINSR